MGWSIGGPDRRGRFVGYGVPAHCDHPKCNAEIDRGLSYVCGGEPFGGDRGCGLYFCSSHLYFHRTRGGMAPQLCARCCASRPPYKHPKPEHPTWVKHLLHDRSWARWRQENPGKVSELRQVIAA